MKPPLNYLGFYTGIKPFKISTEKKIQDYLHLYLGCEVTGKYCDEERRGYLTGVTNGGTECEIQFFCDDDFNVHEHPEFNESADVKLRLSRLEDISEEDMKQCFVLSGGKLPDYIDGEGDQSYFIVRYKHFERLLSFRYELRGLHVNVTHYLLSKGYDLFGLIESGLAIDRKTLQS